MYQLPLTRCFLGRLLSFYLYVLLIPAQALATQQVPDLALQLLVARFQAAYRARDTDQLLSFWTTNAREATAVKAQLAKEFAESRTSPLDIQLAQSPTVVEEEAWLYFKLLPAREPQGQDGIRSEFILYLRNEAGTGWKVSRSARNADTLALILVTMKAESARQPLLKIGQSWNSAELGEGLRTTGDALAVMARYAQAELAHKLGLQVAEESNDAKAIAMSLGGLGVIAQLQGDFATAQSYHQRSLQLAESIQQLESHAAALVNLGNIHFLQGDFGRVQQHYQKALTVTEKASSANTQTAVVLNEIATSAVLGVIELQLAQGNLALAAEMTGKLPAGAGTPVRSPNQE